MPFSVWDVIVGETRGQVHTKSQTKLNLPLTQCNAHFYYIITLWPSLFSIVSTGL